jgi:hypothetical protein
MLRVYIMARCSAPCSFPSASTFPPVPPPCLRKGDEKRNDNLPPNRARDVQRAFRARRTAHLGDLEQRVAELEEENKNHRAALNLPPANRPALVNFGKKKPANRRHSLVHLRLSLTNLRKHTQTKKAMMGCPLTLPSGPVVPLISMSVSLLISNIFPRSRSFSNRPSSNASRSSRKKMVISAPP